MLKFRVVNAEETDTGGRSATIRLVNALQSYPCAIRARNLHGIISLYKTYRGGCRNWLVNTCRGCRRHPAGQTLRGANYALNPFQTGLGAVRGRKSRAIERRRGA